MAKLNAARRNALPAGDFAGPDRSYPVNDASHARNALARVAQHGSAALQAKVRAKVHAKFPNMAHNRQPGELAHHQPGRAHAHSKG